MSKNKNSLSVLCYNKKNTHTTVPFGFRWAPFLIFQLFVALLVVQPNAWAGLSSLTVDANGDSVFNGEDEKLSITFTTDDIGAEDRSYTYKISVDHNGDKDIVSSPNAGIGDELSKNQTVQFIWDGTVEKGENREKLPDGVYTIKVVLSPSLEQGEVLELTAEVTIDTKVEKPTISVDYPEFSPVLHSLAVYYTLDEDVAEAWLEFERAAGGAAIGRPISLGKTSGSHTYYWDGEDSNRRSFDDGKYKLKIRIKDKGGNEIVSDATEEITIDTEEPRITGISINDSIPLVSGMYVNASIQTISFTADDPDGTGLDLTGRDTEITIRPDGGKNINGALTTPGNNKAAFTLGNSLDELRENGEYEVIVFISDKVRNLASNRVKFTFDNAVPILKSVATNRSDFTPGTGLSGWTNFVEATLEDNIELNLADSSIRLKGPDGSNVLGQQTRPADNKIRWQLLSPLLAKDGLQDGQYTVEIVGSDKAGNKTTPILITFLFDNLAPELVSLKPTRDGEAFNILGDTVYYNLPLNQFVATFNDGESGTGVAFSGGQEPTRIVFGTPNPDSSITRISGRAFPDQNNDVLTYILNAPLLKTDGSQDGDYSLNVRATDSLGNTKTYTYRIIYDTQVPTLGTTVPAANQTVSNLSEVVVKLNEVTSGIDFVQSTFRLNRGVGENQVEVPVNISSNGADTATLSLLQPIALDGSDDGTYTIEVTPTDLAGNIGAVVRRQFYLVSRTQPQVRLTTPTTGTVNSLDSITVEINNYIGSGINFDASTITVRNAQGLLVPQAEVESDATSNQLTWSTEATIPRNGTADGRYTITATFVDFSGRRFTQSFPIVLDTQFPSVNSVEVITDPQVQLSLNSATDIPETFSQITIVFDENDIDFENTVVSLTGPGETDIALHRSYDGDTLLTLNFQNLAQLGTYTFTLTPIDRIGNVSETPFIYRFRLDIAVPVVTTVLIGGQSGSVVYVNGSASEIVATLVDTTSAGIAVGDGESTIVVTTDSGLPVPGITTTNDENQLIWQPTALPTDGSADGRYTVAITPVDKVGRTGDVAYRSFILDTQAPRISVATPITLHQPISYIGESLTQFQFTAEDVGPALLDLDDQTIVLNKTSGEAVTGQLTHDGNNQLFFTLSAPLPTDGSADGEYVLTVDLVDKAGNPYQLKHNLFYDSQVPRLSAVSLNTETPLSLTPYQVIDLSESISKLTLNFVESTRVDFTETVIVLAGPDGSAIPLTLENNGIDQIVVSFVSLTQGGLYTLSVTPQDIAGNVAQGAVPYPFRLEFEVPGLASVKANSVAASVGLVQHEIIDISESVSSLTLEFTDAIRVDFKNTRVVLVGPSGQEIPVTLEDNDDSQLMVRFVSLTQSGLYTLSVTPQDIAGNVAQSAMRYQFRLDIALPTVSSVLIDGKLGTNVYVNNANINVVVTLFDPTGVGLALGDEGSTIVVTNAEGLVVSGITTSNGTNELTWTPTVLPVDGSADGRYTVTITPIDKSGRSGTIVNRHFILDTQAPRITASTPVTLYQPVSYIGDSLSYFQFTVEDAGPSLLDLDDQTIGFKKKSGEVVLGQITNDGSNQLFFTLSAPLPTDGSADGEYVLTVDLVDKAGNPYQIEHNISYDSQAPQLSVVSLNTETPLNLTPYEVTDLSESISKLTLKFVEATRVDFAETVITLMNPDGSAVPLTLENNGIDEITVSFVTLTQGGIYTLSVTPQDIAGNVAQGAVPYPFRLEFEVPRLASVKANSVAASVGLAQHEIIDISESISSLTLAFTDAMRVDFKNTGVVLVGPSGQEIPVTLEDNDGSQLMVRFVSLTQSGLYTLSVTPQDIAGNVAQSAMRYQFRLDIALPTVSSVLIDGKLGTNVYANNANINVVATLFDPTGVGLALGDEGSTIVVTNAEGLVVSGIITSNGTNELTWTPTVLPVDGSADGRYTVTITPIDKSGRSGTIVNRHFILDTQAPRITVSTPVTLYQPVSYIGDSLSYFQFTVEDAGPSLLDLDDQTIGFKKKSGEVVSGQITNDGSNQLFFTLSAPLPTDGSADGEYVLTVDLVDKAGNPYQIEHNISYDSQAPQLSIVSLNTETPLDLTPYQVTDLSESISKLTLKFVEATRVDFAETVITLMSPDGSAVPLTLENNGIDEITVSFVTLTQGGIYTLSVTPQDIAGNVAQGAVPYPFRLKFEVPGLTSVKANTADVSLELTSYEITDITESISNLTLAFTDAVRVDFENTIVTLTGEDGQEIPVTLEDDGNSQLVVRFVSLTQSGMYTLSVTPQDIAGNVAQGAVPYPFRLKFAVPGLASVKANTADVSLELTSYEITDITESISNLTLAFTNAARVDLENTIVTLTGEDGQEIPVTLEDDGNSQLVVRFVSLTQSGMYTLSVTPQDIAGNVAQSAVPYPFRLKFEVLGLTLVKANTAEASLELTSYEITDITESISSLTLAFTDAVRVDFKNTIVTLTGEDGQEIPVTLEDDGNSQLVVRFVSLTQSGMYTLFVTPQDIAGNVAQGAVPYPFRLKFAVPGLTSVKANTADVSSELTSYEITDITESISSLTLAFTDAARVDFENTIVTLTGEDGQEIPVTLEDDGNSQLVVRFVSLTQSGMYTLSVTPQDEAGNVAQSAIRYQFRLDIALPTVGSVLIDGKPGSAVYVSRSIPKIVATIIDSIGVGVSFGDKGTTIVVTNDQGIQVPGTTTSNGTNQLTWTPTPLPTDGSADGQYTVTITPVDKAGRSGTVVNRQFIYDTQAPRITEATPVTLHAPVSYLGGGLNQFVLTIEDVGPADLLLVSQVVALMDAAGKPVPAALTHDALTNQLYLTLSKPFASDGSVDGAYTLNVLLIDKAGNSLTSRFAVVYDSQVPQVSSIEVNTAGAPTELVTNQVSELSESIDTITIKFNEVTRIDFANTSVSLIDPDDQTIPITQGDDGVSQLTLSFAGLTQIGQYTLSVTPQDIAGNAAQSPIQFQFNLQFILPDVESITIGDTVTFGSADTAYVNADNLLIVANLLDPAGTGLSFDTLTGSDILVATLDDIIVPGTTSTNGTNLIAWRPLTLSDDGSSDGRYAVYVTPVDKKGREGNTIYREFVYDTQKPEITAADPINLSQPVSYISESLTQLQFTLQDVGPADITLADQKVALRNQNGVVIPTKLTNDSNNQIYLTLNESLPLDGSRDGEYTVHIEFSDKAGNVLDVEHPIVYDTQAPTLVSTVPDHGDQLTEDVTEIQVNLDDKGDSGIDWTLTKVTLVNPDGVEISGELTSNGKSQLTLNTNQLVADGKYIIRVQAIDRAGNGSESVFERSFLLSRRLPAIISTLPSTAPQDEAFTNEKVEQVEVMLETADERHLSTLRLLNAASQVVAGQQHRESGKLIYRLVRPLATDGSEDGLYTIEFTPISSSGRSGEIQELVFAYDTQSPELEPETIQLIVAEPEVNNSLTEIRLPLTDNQAGIDWENLDEEWLTFERLSPNATEIAGRVSFDAQDNLIFRLTVPLADNGSADGEYKISVTPTDKAGNGDETYEKVFIYDTSPPMIDPNSLLINDAPLLTDIDAEDYPSAISTSGGVVIQASVTDTGLGVDLSQSRIVVRNPNGAEISGSTQQNGVDTLVFKSDGLTIEGVHQVLITGIGNDSELLGFAPKGSITTKFLYETTAPTAVVTSDGGKTELTDEPLPLEGTAADRQGTRRAGPQGEGEIPVPASGVWLVEIVGTGPDGQPIEPVPTEDESDAQEEPWSRWSVDFLPTRSGEYDIDIRVTDKAGNYAVYDYGKVTMSVSFSFRGNTFGWPNPLRHSKEDVAFFSFDLNASADEKVDLTLYIYDWGGDMVYSQKYTDITPGERNDTQIKWNLENQVGTPVARGLYVFRLEAVNGAGNRANAVGKILVVD